MLIELILMLSELFIGRTSPIVNETVDLASEVLNFTDRSLSVVLVLNPSIPFL